MTKPLLSVCLITYNHEKYIRQAIEGVLMQKVDFEWELIIADDFSTDKTREIILEFKSQYPDFIKLVFQKKNVGAARNWMDLLQVPKSKYIAYFDGDDYWSDPLKLQKQIDVLEANPNLVGCFHNSEERYWNDYSKASSLYCAFPAGREVAIEELTKYNMVPTASIVFKSPIPTELFSETFLSLPVGDWPLHLLNTRRGNYYYLPQVMSVRNLNPNSVWGMQDHKKNVEQVVHTYKELINSGWFKNEIAHLLQIGCKNVENSIVPHTTANALSRKKRILNKIIRILNKL